MTRRLSEAAQNRAGHLVARLPPGLLRRAGRVAGRHRLLRPIGAGLSRSIRSRPQDIRHGVGAGLRIVAGPSNPGYALGTTEPLVQSALARHLRPGDVFYDVGANVGFFTLLGARLVGEAGRVYAFEPLPDNLQALRRNLSLNDAGQVEVLGVAAAERTGTARLVVTESSLGARLGPPEAADGLVVETLALDDAVVGRGLLPPSLLKIDVEGAEGAVLRGMRSVLAEHRPIIICEVHGVGTPQRVVDGFARALSAVTPGYQVEPLETARSDEVWAPHALAIPR